jgi:hypothetical protein
MEKEEKWLCYVAAHFGIFLWLKASLLSGTKVRENGVHSVGYMEK